jgi:peptidyl-prolyl cis-trans isomerase D
MQLFRKLAGNIFFKIILGIVALSFVLFGVSGFILGNPSSWVAKVGSKTITQSAFNNALRADREIILSATKSEEALQYLETEKFKSDVLGRLVNKIMVDNLKEDFGVAASQKIIFEAIAKDPSFRNDSGKFDREKFKTFLAKNGFNEERYINEIANEVASVMVLQTIAMGIPLNYQTIIEVENFKQEKRVADVITISDKDAASAPKASKEEIAEFYAQNKQHYSTPEMRQVSYLHFSRENFVKDFKISDQEVFAEYEKNKSQMMDPESRNFYHLLFEKEAEAKTFSDAVTKAAGSDKTKLKAEFARLAKEMKKKDLKTLTMNNLFKKDMVGNLAEPTFNLPLNQVSAPIESPLGFHVFLVTDIKESTPIPFSEVKASIRENLTRGREEKILQEKISGIDEVLLTSSSLNEVAKKFNFKTNPVVTVSVSGQNENGAPVKESTAFEGFVENSFALKEGQVSKIFYAKNSSGFYVLKLEKIIPARERKLAEIEGQLTKDLLKEKSLRSVKELAKKIAKEVQENPGQVAQIAAKYKVKLDKNREFPRSFYISLQGRNVPYQSKFLEELFNLDVNQATDAITQNEKEFAVAVLKEIKHKKADLAQMQQAQNQAIEDLRMEIMSEYNSYLLKLYPVKVNDKIFAKKEE